MNDMSHGYIWTSDKRNKKHVPIAIFDKKINISDRERLDVKENDDHDLLNDCEYNHDKSIWITRWIYSG